MARAPRRGGLTAAWQCAQAFVDTCEGDAGLRAAHFGELFDQLTLAERVERLEALVWQCARDRALGVIAQDAREHEVLAG